MIFFNNLTDVITVNQIPNNSIINADGLEAMKYIKDKSVNMILADLPYGTTSCKWDIILPFDLLWEQYHRIIKDNGAIVLFGGEPFTSKLRFSNIDNWKYDWVWEKSKTSNYPHAKNMPLKFHEDICVFSLSKVGHKSQLGDKRMIYNPQGLIKVDKKWVRKKKYDSEHNLKKKSHKLERIIEFTNYPKTILKFGNTDINDRGLHPTQKPIKLLEYLISTYTQVGDLVLDNVAGSGSTGIACINTNRDYILMENNDIYFEQLRERLMSHV